MQKTIYLSNQNYYKKLGELPLINEGDIDIVTNIIDELKSHYPTHYSF